MTTSVMQESQYCLVVLGKMCFFHGKVLAGGGSRTGVGVKLRVVEVMDDVCDLLYRSIPSIKISTLALHCFLRIDISEVKKMEG